KGWKDVYTCRLTIGEVGQARAVAPYREPWPLACVGDEVVIPLFFDEQTADHRYALSRDERPLEEAFRHGARENEEAWVARGNPPACDLRNGANDSLELIATKVSSVVDCPGISTAHYLSAVFEAKKAGRYGLRMKLTPAGHAMPDKGHCSAEVLPRGQPIR